MEIRLEIKDKDFISSIYDQLEFEDVPGALKCDGCGHVLIYNFKTECGHHICKSCIQKHKKSCPSCKTTFKNKPTNVDEVEGQLPYLQTRCKKCKEAIILKYLQIHLNECKANNENNLPAISYQGLNLKQVNQRFDEISNNFKEVFNQFGQIQANAKNDHNQLQNYVENKLEAFEKRLKLLSSNLDKLPQTVIQEIQKTLSFQSANENVSDMDTKYKYPGKLKTINILLLGETGCGKSSFVNAANTYFKNEAFDDVKKEKADCLIPTKITLTDEDYKTITVKHDVTDPNENMDPNESSTRKSRSYLFTCKNSIPIRFIDTPGFASTWGPRHDDVSVDEIVHFVSQYDELHAIAILVKGNQSTLTLTFEFWLQQILAMLPKSATENIIFVFSCGKKPGNSLITLQRGIERIKQSYPLLPKIEQSKTNTFALENEGFNTVVAMCKKITIDEASADISKENWTSAKKEFERLMNYIKSINPINVKDMGNVNEARTLRYNILSVIRRIDDDIVKIENQIAKSEVADAITTKAKIDELNKRREQLVEALSVTADFILKEAILCCNLKAKDYVSDFSKINPKVKIATTDQLLIDYVTEFVKKGQSSVNFSDIQNLSEEIMKTAMSSTIFGYPVTINSYNEKDAEKTIPIASQTHPR